ncbi:MAG: MarR family transcriptional regulator [Bacteroidia bacterium]|nr:MarR family transcriptional regulator [Bacteroidia bacterium]
MESFLDRSMGYLNHVTALLLKRELLEAIKLNKIDVTPEQWAVLNRLSELNGLTQKEIAKITFKDAANVTRIIDKLQEKNMIERKAKPDDRRTWRVHITKEGQRVRDLIEPLAIEVLKKATRGVGSDDISRYNEVARKIINNLER